SHDKDGSILKNTLKIDDSSIDVTYNSLRNHISLVTRAVEGIHEENIKSPLGVYGAVTFAVEGYKDWERIKKGVNFFSWIKKFVK
ncbi:MAG: hypothetical protein HQK96_08595, partial [Nitrospirae bacterium]|nr:hypothetical protein [Nitrospirota bacterium]